MEIREIVADWLKTHGYDGLFDGDGECGCTLDDFMPCTEISEHCEAGYKTPCDGSGEFCDGDCDFHVGPNKPDHIPDGGKTVESEGSCNAEA